MNFFVVFSIYKKLRIIAKFHRITFFFKENITVAD